MIGRYTRLGSVPPTQGPSPAAGANSPAADGTDFSEMWRTITALVAGVGFGGLVGSVLGNIIWTLGGGQ